jgi:GTP-binding protein
LEKHSEELGRRPEIVVVSKADLPGSSEVRERLAETSGREVLLISAVTGQGLNELVGRIAQMLQGPAPAW